MAESTVLQPLQLQEPVPQVNDESPRDAEERHHSMERLMKKLGVLGRYQLSQIVLVYLSSTLFAFVMLNFVFISYEHDHRCKEINETDLLERHSLLSDNTTQVKYGACEITVTSRSTGKERHVLSIGCYGGYSYAGSKDSSFVTEWDLVCEKRGLVGLLQAMFILGAGLGTIVFTSLGDRYGRKYFYALDIAVVIVSELGLTFAPNICTAIALRFCSGFTAGGMCLFHIVISGELVVTKYRQAFWALDCIWFSFNTMMLSGIAYLLRDNDWRCLQLVTPLLGIHIFLAAFALRETPVWYFAKGRYAEARAVLRRACRMNGKDVNEVLEIFQSCIKRAKLKSDGDSGKNYSLLDIWRNRYIFMIVVISSFTWFTTSLAYYGLYLTSSTLAGDRFLNFFLMALLEIPASLLSVLMLAYLGRRSVVFIFMAITTLSLLVSTCLVALRSDDGHVANASTVFFLVGKFCAGSSYNVVTAYTPELMATSMRSAGTGLCAVLSRVGGIIAPFLLPLFKLVPWAPGAILTSLCLINLAVLPLLPETKGRQLANTFEEIEEWKKSKGKENEGNTISVDKM